MALSGKAFGEVTSVQRVPYTDMRALNDGTTVTVEYRNAYTYIVKAKATLLEKNGFLRTAKNDVIAVGETLTMTTEYFKGVAIVTDIK